MAPFNIHDYVKHGRTIGGQNAYQLKRDGFIDSSFRFVEADDIESLMRELENLRSHFVYEGERLHFVAPGERLEFEYINVMQQGDTLHYTMAYRPSPN